MTYYLSGTRAGLTEDAAKKLATERAPAVARELAGDNGLWYVAFLATGPVQHGQAEFRLYSWERPEGVNP